jgi:hypothetical protein
MAGAAGLASVPWLSTAAPISTRQTAAQVSGRVVAGGTGLGGVAVTDGWTVVETDADGRFSFRSGPQQPFVYITVPSGTRIPQNEPGTARFYRRIDPDDSGRFTAQFDLQNTERPATEHAFVVLADPQTEDEAEIEKLHAETVPDVQETVQSLGDVPAFGVGNGDIMFDNLELFPDYERAVQRMGIPFWQVVGNHDLDFDSPTDAGSTRTFERHFGPRYYSFDRGDVHYVVLDDVFWPGSDGYGSGTDDYIGHIDDAQLHWLQQDLGRLEEGRTVIVFAHIPALSTAFRRRGSDSPSPGGQIMNRQAVYDLLDPFDAHMIFGHVHENEHRFVDGRHEHVVGAACGAWWSGPICWDGAPKGYAVYEIDGTDVSWRYQATGHDADHQMRLYPPGTDANGTGELVANVWDADPAWTVVWFEDGVRRGEMERRVGTDPLSEKLHRGEDTPAKRSWVEPMPTNHLYYAATSNDATRFRVEATDRFGRTYTASAEASGRR